MKEDERAVLVDRRVLSPDAQLLFFQAPKLSTSFLPGQFTMLRAPGQGLLLRRPYSICSAEPDKGRFSLLVKVVGQGTRALTELPMGGEVQCLGPLGTSFEPPTGGRRPVIVAGGVGIAPFLCFCDSLAREGIVAKVLLGGRQSQDLYLKDDFAELGMDVYCTTEDGSYGRMGMVTDLLTEVLDESRAVRLYSCGPSAMLRRVAEIAAERNVPHQVSIERRMGCGMGCCLGCVVFTRLPGETEAEGEYRRACTEGPVFEADQIVWNRDPHPL
jgi:dihydroorotate dehydrogenase electron transfer subunit